MHKKTCGLPRAVHVGERSVALRSKYKRRELADGGGGCGGWLGRVPASIAVSSREGSMRAGDVWMCWVGASMLEGWGHVQVLAGCVGGPSVGAHVRSAAACLCVRVCVRALVRVLVRACLRDGVCGGVEWMRVGEHVRADVRGDVYEPTAMELDSDARCACSSQP